ncbi:hypothetical protein STRCI_007938 [Streptomyces cinnabarinus]|uniref:Tetratricopeptide repeat protein n=1 Tax=Streptomyces cinnabarinus TaxID=67287 RepID=A0ABY7KP67_9ACTN|nr:hypothetical protein [Streptomyces cinnabarinus]WAZ26372.1 hypothetical protein STRCI_007938 [Streptomyces cinnabarinus]
MAFQAGQGEWFCARDWARRLGDQGRLAQALEVLTPYVATGWWPAAQAQAELLENWGRVEEAIALACPYARTGGPPLEVLARLLARHGRNDEAVTRLIPGIEDWVLATTLVEIAAGTDRDEDIAALLAARIPADHRCEDPWCCRGLDPDTAVGLLAVIRERQGRVDEAIALLRTRHITSVNHHDQLADLLARHGRIEELRAYARSEDLGLATQRLAEVLEEHGDVEGAIAAYRQTDDSDDSPVCRPRNAVQLAALLARHGRGGEAIEVMRTVVDEPGGADDWLVDTLCTLYADHGRAHDGLAHLDVLKARHGGEEEWDFFMLRLRLMADCGRLDEGIARARVHPEGGTSYAAVTISDLLAKTGRTEEAVAVLEPHATANRAAMAALLIELGRVKEAVALLQWRRSEPVEHVWSGTFRRTDRPQ